MPICEKQPLRKNHRIWLSKRVLQFPLKKIFTLFLFFCMVCVAYAAQDQGPPALPTEEIAPLPSSDQLTESYEGSFMRVILSLLGLVVLVIMTFWILKRLGRGRFGKFGSDKNIHIIERRPLSPKSV